MFSKFLSLCIWPVYLKWDNHIRLLMEASSGNRGSQMLLSMKACEFEKCKHEATVLDDFYGQFSYTKVNMHILYDLL